jgi:UDP-2,4-diacetamido-2,4,6-trideoxy-beta-L-altropyranose hydrolase
MNVVFRVDSSSQIGLGHLMRCLVLAKQYKQDNIIFATQELAGNVNHKIKECGYQHINLSDNNTQTLINTVVSNAVDLLVFDHYDIGYQFEKTIKDETGVKILSFDDTYQQHYCDVLLNHNIYAKDEDYQGLVPNFCKLRCGEKYTLIRDEFKKLKPKNRRINKNNLTIFVAMGGSDINNISLEVLKVLIGVNCTTVNLATTNANSNIDTLLEFSKQYSQVNIHINHSNVAQLMDDSDFAIITPSVTVYEVMALNLPFIAIQTADNQHYLANYLENDNFLLARTWNSNHIQTLIQSLLDL